ncbi:MAG: family N-acetyltransferase [Adhaeribacter sp.]|jgi:N-acetylglutamate synthase-like GNAT family acetyltransferase|nr:family N-acetyltransferase [Adhaeribacter sp.]
MKIIAPHTAADFRKYYRLRYDVLRAPWQQPPGSEKADDDVTATHALMLNDAGAAVGVCRLHLASTAEAQIRFMAIHPDYQGQGLGKILLHYLEEKARLQGARFITLQAREAAVTFYQNCGYTVMAQTHLLYGSIQHYQMRKALI